MPKIRVLLYSLIFEEEPMREERIQMVVPYALRDPHGYREAITAALASGADLSDAFPGLLPHSDEVIREFLAEVCRRLPPAY